MVDRVYGQPRPEALAELAERSLAQVPFKIKLPKGLRQKRGSRSGTSPKASRKSGFSARPVRFERTTTGFEGRRPRARSSGIRGNLTVGLAAESRPIPL
jgi:hypothetical protein